MLSFWAYRARRDGRPIPRWQLHNSTWEPCRLAVAEQQDAILGRTVPVARAVDVRGDDAFPPLLDARLLLADHTRLVLSGIESAAPEMGQRAQTWVLHTHPQDGSGAALVFWARRERNDGRILSEAAIGARHWAAGRLRVSEEPDAWLGRTVRVCRLVSEAGGDAFEPLIEGQLLHATEDALVFAGIERDPLTRCDYLQGWVLHPRRSGGADGERSPSKSRTDAAMLPP